MHILALSPIN